MNKFSIREEKYYVVEREEVYGIEGAIPVLKITVATFDTAREAEAVKAALEALEP